MRQAESDIAAVHVLSWCLNKWINEWIKGD
jgi:hypothetical protein